MANKKSNAPVGLALQQLRIPGYVDTWLLAGVAVTVTRPTWAYWCWLRVSDDCTLNINGTAADITATVVDGSGNFLLQPAESYIFRVEGVTSFSIFGTGKVCAAWYGDESKP